MSHAFLLVLLLVIGIIRSQIPIQTQPEKQTQTEKKPDQQKPESDQGVIKFDTTVVVLNVTVTDIGERFVRGLKAKDFKILEDQAPQRISSFSVEEMPFAAAILLDTSGSMERKMSIARAACSRFIDGTRLGDVVGIYGFGGTKVTKLQDFTEVKNVDFAVWDTDASGMTPLYDGIVKASEELAKREERRRVILLLSDGADTSSKASYDEALRRTANAEVSVYAVDLSDAALYKTGARDLGAEIMRTLSQKTGGRFFKTPGGSQLGDAFSQTIDELRNQYTITYETTNEKRDGKWRAIQTTVAFPGLSVRTRQGYYAAKK